MDPLTPPTARRWPPAQPPPARPPVQAPPAAAWPAQRQPCASPASSARAAAAVEGGVQDACGDASICLEAFCHSDSSTVTNCKHDFHLQCILEW
ncbi:hypothetical protein ZWY2020_000427 [Hordeum vulgare]|nr:hypothetical protein ZWY2020_000427 [Hordeum vulgare]